MPIELVMVSAAEEGAASINEAARLQVNRPQLRQDRIKAEGPLSDRGLLEVACIVAADSVRLAGVGSHAKSDSNSKIRSRPSGRLADRSKEVRRYPSSAMPSAVEKSPDPLAELERRQDEALRQLDELEAEIDRALREFVAVQETTAQLFGRKQKAA